MFHVKKLEFVNVSDGKSASSGSSWLERHFRVIIGFAVGHCIRWCEQEEHLGSCGSSAGARCWGSGRQG